MPKSMETYSTITRFDASRQYTGRKGKLRFELADKAPVIIVEANVNGKGPFKLLVDTGSSAPVITEEIFETLGFHSKSPKTGKHSGGCCASTVVKLRFMQMGKTEANDVPVVLGNLSAISRDIGTKTDGIIGYNFMKNYRVIIDYSRRQITFKRSAVRFGGTNQHKIEGLRNEQNRLMKQELKENLLSPLPVVLVGAMVNSRLNYLVIGYISPFGFGRYIFFSLYKKRYTRIGIHQNRTFSVNIPSEDLLAEAAVCGSRSGRDFDKESLFDTFYGELKTAPMIRQCPINIECEITEILDYDPNEGIFGRVVKSYADSKCLTDGKLDWRKIHPIIWATGGDFNYYKLGERIRCVKDKTD